MQFGVFHRPALPSGLCHPPGLAKFRLETPAYIQFMSVNVNWTGLDLQGAEVEFVLEWQEEEFCFWDETKYFYKKLSIRD